MEILDILYIKKHIKPEERQQRSYLMGTGGGRKKKIEGQYNQLSYTSQQIHVMQITPFAHTLITKSRN